MFGLALLALVLVQTNAVPAANEAVEFDHSQAVQQDLLGLEAEVSDAAATGRGGAELVTLGTDYPNRFLLRNPPPVAGTLSTEPAGFTLANARAVDNPETADYWSGAARAFDSNRLVYRVDYNVYDGAPTTVIAHGAVYDRFPNGRVLRIDERGLVDGRRIDLTALQGRRGGSRVGPVSVSVTGVSAPTRTVRVTDTGTPVTLTLQTEASAAAWRSFLAEQFVAEGGHVQAVRDGGSGAVEVVLEPGVTYELQLASVAVGTGRTDPGPHYLTAVTDAPSTTAGQPVDLTTEVRDRFNGPVAGEDITFETTDGSLSATTATSDDEGRATVRFIPDAAGTATVTASADLDGSGTVEPREEVTFSVSVAAAGDGGGGGDQGDFIDQGYESNIRLTGVSDPYGPNSNIVDITFRNDGSTKKLTQARFIAFYDGSVSCPCPFRLRIAQTDPTLSLGEPAQTLAKSVTFSRGGTTTLSFDFRDRGNTPSGVTKEDWVLVRLYYDDGTASTYFIQMDPTRYR